MAADSSSSSKRKLSDREEKTGKSGEKKPKKESDSSCLSPAKRTKNPGVRVIGGRVYDSDKGRTCHQCRQKTLDFVAACKNQKKNKPCTIMFCHKCLFNRYGEKAEKMADLEDWICPKCRGICNCSLCMKKRGHRPTGILVHTARATGFSSVSDMLNVKGPENLGIGRTVKGIDIGTEAVASEREEPPIALPRKRGKENSFSETNVSASNFAEQKQKKMKYGRLKVMPDRKQDEWTLSNSPLMPPVSNHSLRDMQDGTQDEWTLSKKCCPSPQKCQIAKEGLKAKKVSNWADESMMRETIHRKPEISNGVSKKDVTNGQTVLDVEEAKLVPVMSKGVSSKLKKCEKSKEQRNSKCQKDLEVLDTKKLDYAGAQLLIPVESYKGQTKDLELLNKDIDANITLPEGTELTSVAGIDLPPEDVGHALEFLEFCSAFGKKGEPEHILQEICGEHRRRRQYSPVANFHVQLLGLIQNDLGENSPVTLSIKAKNSWLHALQNCASRSKCLLKKLKLEHFGQKADDYYNLNSSEKIRLLNFLCDEVLCTTKIRSWIDDQNLKFAKKAKEAKEQVLAERHKEKQLKQKMQDEMAIALIAKNGLPLSISEHDAIVSQIKIEAAQAHAKMLEAKGKVPKGKPTSDAVRTEPILLDVNGHRYWRLKGYPNKSNVVLQDVGIWDAVESGEKWFTFDVEQEKEIEKYIYSLRKTKPKPRSQTLKRLSSISSQADLG
ncbi:uncharacterized protein LOC127804687 isoform X2 [Diospyros lotus]|uniref:uncharacterized protein LOC127804687 isoform X2 n=1 Tax=Diospyros lotus TaxID=55363 RepID=UPI00224E32E6|nr:uncharacterized protein LOC127804687 isoform X2 [Diospyros lotus]